MGMMKKIVSNILNKTFKIEYWLPLFLPKSYFKQEININFFVGLQAINNYIV